MCTKSREKCAGHSWFGAPVVLCTVQGRKPEREEFSSVSVSGEKKRWSTGESGLRLVQYNLSLMELVSLDSGPHKPSHTAPRQPQAQAGRGCPTHHAPHRQIPGAIGLSEGSQVKPVVFKCSQHSLLSHRHPRVIPTQQPGELWSKLQMSAAFSSFSTQTVGVVTHSSTNITCGTIDMSKREAWGWRNQKRGYKLVRQVWLVGKTSTESGSEMEGLIYE